MSGTPNLSTDRFALKMGLFYAAYFLFGGIQLPFFPLWLEARGIDARTIGLVIAAPMLVRIFITPFARPCRRPHRRTEGHAGDLRVGGLVSMTAVGLAEGTLAILVAFTVSACSSARSCRSATPTRSTGWARGRVPTGRCGCGARLPSSPPMSAPAAAGNLRAAISGLVHGRGAGRHRTRGGQPGTARRRRPAPAGPPRRCRAVGQSGVSRWSPRRRASPRAAMRCTTDFPPSTGATPASTAPPSACCGASACWPRSGCSRCRRGSPADLAPACCGHRGAGGALRWTAMASIRRSAAAGAAALHALSFGAAHLGAMGFFARAVPKELAATAQGAVASVRRRHGLGDADCPDCCTRRRRTRLSRHGGDGAHGRALRAGRASICRAARGRLAAVSVVTRHSGYIAASSLPRRKIILRDSPPRELIQLRTCCG